MSSFRQNFTPAQPAPRRAWRGWLAFHVVMCSLVIAAGYAQRSPAEASQVATPVFPPAPAMLDDHALMQMRLEAFRAGFAAGLEQGCHVPRLSRPIGGAS